MSFIFSILFYIFQRYSLSLNPDCSPIKYLTVLRLLNDFASMVATKLRLLHLEVLGLYLDEFHSKLSVKPMGIWLLGFQIIILSD